MNDSSRTFFRFAMTLVFTSAAMGLATADIYERLWNFDVKNTTGVTANDFHLFVGGISPHRVVNNVFLTYDVQVGNGGTSIDWHNGSVPNDGWMHAGIAWFTPPFPENPTAIDMYWTVDGTNVGAPMVRGGHWETTDYNMPIIIFPDAIIPPNRPPFFMQFGFLGLPGPSPPLEDLVVGGPLWNNATWLDPVRIGPTDTFSFNYLTAYPQLAGQQASYTAIVKMFTDEGGLMGPLVSVSFEEVDILPEPSAVGFLGTGVLTLLVARGAAKARRLWLRRRPTPTATAPPRAAGRRSLGSGMITGSPSTINRSIDSVPKKEAPCGPS